MPQFTSPRFERVFVAPITTFGQIPNSSGTWNNTGAKVLRVAGANGCKLSAGAPLTPVPWKTGTRSSQPGILGRKGGSFSLPNMSVILSGTPGTPPDMDLVLQGIFGQAPAVVASTSVTYSFADATFVPFALARFQHNLSGLTNQFAHGCTPESASFTLNQNIFEMSVSGSAFWVLDSENFANEDSAGQGGLTVFPAEPSNPVITGAVMPGFQGVATFDGTGMTGATAPLISASINIRTGNALITDAFGNTYPAMQIGGERSVSISATFMDTDSSALNDLKTKAKAKTPLNISLQVGVTAGYIATFTLKSVQLNIASYNDDNTRVTASFGESTAHASAIGNLDDLTLVLT